jgi:hypothetical protein
VGKFDITVSKLIGSPEGTSWAQVHEFTPDDEEKLNLRGRLVAVIATTSQKQEAPDEEIDNVVAGRELLTRLHEEYFGSTEKTAFNALVDAVGKVINEFSEVWGDVEIAAASIVGDVIYTACGGGSQAAIYRNGMLAKVLVSQENGPVSASGHPQEGDIFLLGTKKVFTSLSESVIKAALGGSGASEAVESLAPSVHSMKEIGDFGLVLMEFSKTPAIFTKPKEEPEIEREKSKNIPLKKSRISFPPLLRKATSKVAPFLSKKMGRRKIYVRQRGEDEFNQQKKKTTVSIGAILTIILIVSIGFGIRQKVVKDEKAKYEDRLSQAQHEFDEAQSLYTLNPERARELFRNAKRLVYQIKDEGVEDSELDSLASLITDSEGQILGEYTLEPDLFLDLSILSDGFKADEVAASEGNLYILDRDGEKIAQIEIDTKKTEIVAGPDQVGKAEKLAAYSDRAFVLSDGNIYEVSNEREEVIEGDWQGNVLIYAYAGNFYVLETGSSKIWRYAGAEGSFGSKQTWLAPGVEPDLSNIFTWTIDGSIWMLSETGKVFKFTRGNQDSLGFNEIAPPLSHPSAIYTNEELKFVYLLEREAGRIVVIDKEGNYQAQYFSDKIREAKSLVVSEEVGKMIIVTDERLYSIDISHKLD